jgi:DNA-binding TFAR19-related protein (PDSD5 family)
LTLCARIVCPCYVERAAQAKLLASAQPAEGNAKPAADKEEQRQAEQEARQEMMAQILLPEARERRAFAVSTTPI